MRRTSALPRVPSAIRASQHTTALKYGTCNLCSITQSGDVIKYRRGALKRGKNKQYTSCKQIVKSRYDTSSIFSIFSISLLPF